MAFSVRRPATLAAVLIALGAPVSADDNPVVVELYTSQGCSSCPPADAMLRDMAQMPGVIPLALHVDYWDYIGWADTFASPAFTARQQDYARAAGERTVYTPQLIIGGRDAVVGANAMAVMAHVQAHAALETGVHLRLERDGRRLRIRAESAAAFAQPVMVQLVRFIPHERVEIGQGENAGQVVDYTNIVTEWRMIGTWDGAAPLAMDSDLPGSDPAVVILQEPGPGLILAAQLAD
jgi:hypothetical protein